MAEFLSEIPLPGRMLALTMARANGKEATMPSFVAGPENRVVAGTVSRLLNTACKAPQNPSPSTAATVLALFGGSGTGKTHLAQGLVDYWRQRRGQDTAQYLTATDFRRQLTAAMDGNDILKFRDAIRGRQLLAIDGLHQFPDDDYLLQELRYTLDSYDDEGGFVLVTSDRPVNNLGNLSADIRSRLASGLVLEVSPPGSDARMRIIRQASTALAAPVSDDAAATLARGVPGTANELFGALFELIAHTNGTGKTECDAKRADQFLADRAAQQPTLREIISVVAKYNGLAQKQLKSSTRRQSAVGARAMVIYLARELADVSYEEIGRALGGRDHTTIIHSFRKIDRERQHDATIREALDDLRRILLSR